MLTYEQAKELILSTIANSKVIHAIKDDDGYIFTLSQKNGKPIFGAEHKVTYDGEIKGYSIFSDPAHHKKICNNILE